MREPEMAKWKRGERKDRGRLKRTTPPPNLAATSPLLLCLHTHPRKLVLVCHQCDRTEEQGMNRGGGQGPAAFLKLLFFSSPPLSLIVLSLLLSLLRSLILVVFSVALVLLLPFSDSLLFLVSFALLSCLLPCASSF